MLDCLDDDDPEVRAAAKQVVEKLIAMPLTALLAVEASVLISSRVSDVRSAQQYSGVILLPFFFLYVAAEVFLTLDAPTLVYISAGVGAVAVLLFFVSTRAFRRDEILTQWT